MNYVYIHTLQQCVITRSSHPHYHFISMWKWNRNDKKDEKITLFIAWVNWMARNWGLYLMQTICLTLYVTQHRNVRKLSKFRCDRCIKRVCIPDAKCFIRVTTCVMTRGLLLSCHNYSYRDQVLWSLLPQKVIHYFIDMRIVKTYFPRA